jgi:hypothetical protein
VRYRRDVADRRDIEPGRLQRSYSRFSPAAGALHEYNYRAHSKISDLACSRLCRHLRGEWCSLARPLKTDRTRAGPRDDGSMRIRNRDNRIVERRMNMGDALRHAASRSPSSWRRRCSSRCSGCRRCIRSGGACTWWGSGCASLARCLLFPFVSHVIPKMSLRQTGKPVSLNPLTAAPSFPLQLYVALCAYVHWCGFVGHEPAALGDVADRDSSRDPSAA